MQSSHIPLNRVSCDISPSFGRARAMVDASRYLSYIPPAQRSNNDREAYIVMCPADAAWLGDAWCYKRPPPARPCVRRLGGWPSLFARVLSPGGDTIGMLGKLDSAASWKGSRWQTIKSLLAGVSIRLYRCMVKMVKMEK